MTNFENGNFTGTGVPSAEMLINNAETKYDLGNVEAATKDYSDAMNYYPQDYRGYLGMIKIITNNFSKNTMEGIKDDLTKYARAIENLNIPETDYKNVKESLSKYFNNVKPEETKQHNKLLYAIDALKSAIKVFKKEKTVLQQKIDNYDTDLELKKEEMQFDELAVSTESEGYKSTKLYTVASIVAFILGGILLLFVFGVFKVNMDAVYGVVGGIVETVAVIFLLKRYGLTKIISVLFSYGFISLIIGVIAIGLINFVISSIIASKIGMAVMAVALIALGYFSLQWQKDSDNNVINKKKEKTEELASLKDQNLKQIQYDTEMKEANIAEYQKQIDDYNNSIDYCTDVLSQFEKLENDEQVRKEFVYQAGRSALSLPQQSVNEEFDRTYEELEKFNVFKLM